MRLSILYGFLLSLTLSSCEEEIFFSNPNFKSQIVLNSIFSLDSTWIIKLTYTTSVFAPKDTLNFIDDAKIIITDQSGQGVCDLYYAGKGIYKSIQCKPGYNQNFSIFVNSKKYGSVFSTSVVPQKSSLEYIKKIENSDIENTNEIEFQIKDQNLDNKYFIWSIVEVDTSKKETGQSTSFETVPLDIKSWVDDIKEQAHLIKSGKLNSSLALSGIELEANDFTTTIYTTKKIYTEDDPPPPAQISKVPMLRLLTVSEDLYQYYKSLEDYLKYNNNNASVIEPQKIYSNIEGGYGIFAGYSIQYIRIP